MCACGFTTHKLSSFPFSSYVRKNIRIFKRRANHPKHKPMPFIPTSDLIWKIVLEPAPVKELLYAKQKKSTVKNYWVVKAVEQQLFNIQATISRREADYAGSYCKKPVQPCCTYSELHIYFCHCIAVIALYPSCQDTRRNRRLSVNGGGEKKEGEAAGKSLKREKRAAEEKRKKFLIKAGKDPKERERNRSSPAHMGLLMLLYFIPDMTETKIVWS